MKNRCVNTQHVDGDKLRDQFRNDNIFSEVGEDYNLLGMWPSILGKHIPTLHNNLLPLSPTLKLEVADPSEKQV
jgi:hypothetical protein